MLNNDEKIKNKLNEKEEKKECEICNEIKFPIPNPQSPI